MMKSLIVIFFSFIFCLSLFAQEEDHSDPFKRFRKMREKILQQFFQDDPFKHSLIDEDDFKGSFFNNEWHGFGQNSSVQTSWEEKNNDIILHLKMGKNRKGENLDIKVQDGMVSISGRMEETVEHEDPQGNKSISRSSQHFSQSFPLHPLANGQDYNVKKTNSGLDLYFKKLEGKKISIPKKKKREEKQDPPGLRPLRPRPDDHVI